MTTVSVSSSESKIASVNPRVIPEPKRSRLSNLSIGEKVKLSTKVVQDLSEYVPKDILKGEVKMTIRNREVYLEDKHGGKRKIGISNRTLKGRTLKWDPINSQEEAKDLVTSCISSKTKSSSPSMILHQIASMCICMSSLSDCLFEEQASYTPDIIMLPENDKIYVDICGINMERKLEYVESRIKGTIVIINKYKLLSEINEDFATLFKLSHLNDSSNPGFIYEQAKKYAAHSSCELFYTQATLSFFMLGRDKLARGIEQHSHFAEKAFKALMVEEIDSLPEEIPKVPHMDILKDTCKEILKLLDVRYQVSRECDYYLFAECFDYEDMEVIKTPIVHNVEESAYLSLEYESEEGSTKLYEMINEIRVHPKSLSTASKYSINKEDRDVSSLPDIMELLRIYRNCDIAYYKYMAARTAAHSNYCYDAETSDFYFRKKNYKTTDRMCASRPILSKRLLPNSWRVVPKRIDPDHQILLEKENCKPVIELLSYMRDYNDLRFRARISVAIMNVKQAGKCFRVSHWMAKNRHAEVKISGKLFTTDGGVAVVSFFEEDMLCRTEKWRLPDVENYSVAHHRLVGLSLSLFKEMKTVSRILWPMIIYARVLSENSWGLSEFFKSFRYFSTGYLVSSPELKKQSQKMVKSLNKSSKSKLSTLMIIDLMSKQTKLKVTPAFGFEYKDLGWEIFLINLCPSKTYGRRKHLSDVLRELYGEINLYNSKKDLVKELFDDFDKILSAKNLEKAYRDHYKLIKKVSMGTMGRFTYSPSCNVLQYKSLSELKINYSKFQSNLPNISELMTAKASTDPYNGRNSIATDTITSLTEELGTQSTSMLILKLLNNKNVVDLSMRMFDKDAVGSNREISILSAPFRLIQVCLERFFWSFSNLTENSMIHRTDKLDELYRQVENALNSKAKLLATIDQTRWGPNNNTVKYGFLSAMMCRKTTEAYLPTLVALIMEFKVFEVPSWLDEHYGEIDNAYFLPGKTGRSHMGQGICQDSSTADHSLITMTIQRLYAEIVQEKISLVVSRNVSIVYSSLITSDDAAHINYVVVPDRMVIHENEKEMSFDERTALMDDIELELPVIQKEYEKCYAIYPEVVQYFGILTSDYKNMFVDNSIEFNCEFLSDVGIGSNELKFVYSLIDPHTTGSFTLDYKSVLDKYYSSTNSGCKRNSSMAIVELNFLKFCRQWKMRTDIVGVPSQNTILYGLLPTVDQIDAPSLFKFDTGSHLRYKTRSLLKNTKYDEDNISSVLMRIKHESISNSREKEAFRSCITYGNCKEKISTCSEYYDAFGAVGETCESFVKHQNADPTHYYRILNREYQKPYTALLNEKHTNGRMFQKKILVRSDVEDFGVWELVLSTREAVESISSKSSIDDINFHMMREMRTGELIEDELGIQGMSLAEQLSYLNDVKEEMSRKTATCISYQFDLEKAERLYLQTELIPPNVIATIKLSFSTKKPLARIDLTRRYALAGDYISDLVVNSYGEVNLVEDSGFLDYRMSGYTRIEVTEPDIEECLSYLDEYIIGVNDKFNESNEILASFANIMVEEVGRYEDADLTSATEVEEFDEFDIEKLLDRMEKEHLEHVIQFAKQEEEMTEEQEIAMELFSQGNAKRYYSVRLSPRYSLYSGKYFRNRIPTNAVLRKLLELGVIHVDDLASIPGYCIDHLTGIRSLVTDKRMPSKVHKMVQRMKTKFYNLTGRNRPSWADLILSAITGEDFRDNFARNKVCVLIPDTLMNITTEPLGEILSSAQFMDLINERMI